MSLLRLYLSSISAAASSFDVLKIWPDGGCERCLSLAKMWTTEPTMTRCDGFCCVLAVSRSLGMASIDTRNVEITLIVMVDSLPCSVSQWLTSMPALAMKASSLDKVFKRPPNASTEL